MNKDSKYCLYKSSEELKRLIAENPDLPIAVLASDEANCGDWCWQYCNSISFEICEILDCDYMDYDDVVFTDRERLEEKIGDDLYDEYCDKGQEEYDEAVNRKMEELEPYWQKVIAIFASN